MRGLWDALSALSIVARWSLLGVGALLLVLVIGTAMWSFTERRAATAGQALATASVTYRQAMASGQAPDLGAAANDLGQFLKDYPRSSGAAQGWYFLGNVEYQRRNLDAAHQAYQEAMHRGSGSTAALSRLGLGYVWEAKGDPDKALEAYTQGLEGRGPKDFLYGEFLFGKARMQEQLQRRTEAIETYRKLLADVPDSPQSEEVRIRLAILGAGA